MSVTPIDLDVDATVLKYGTVVADGIFAPHHQHIFNLRVDPAIDGYTDSTIVYDDTVAMPRDEKNPHGVGFEVHSVPIEKECAFNLDWTTNRAVKMVNPTKLNPFSKKPVGYKVVRTSLSFRIPKSPLVMLTCVSSNPVPPTQLGLAHETSMHNRRGEFVNNHMHVTKYDNGELFGAGEHPWQSVGGQGGCRTWSQRAQALARGQSVLWITLGFTHTTKSEGMSIHSSLNSASSTGAHPFLHRLAPNALRGVQDALQARWILR